MSHINTVGWLKLWRQIVVSDVWGENDPYDSRSAFLFILSQAWFTPGYYRGVRVERGQFPTSERELSEIFKWSKGKVHRFLKGLFEKKSIQFEYFPDHRTTLITIMNFDTFQGDCRPVTDQKQTSDGPVTDQKQTSDGPQYKKEEQKKQEGKRLSPAIAGTPSAEESPEPPIGSPEWLKLHYDD